MNNPVAKDPGTTQGAKMKKKMTPAGWYDNACDFNRLY